MYVYNTTTYTLSASNSTNSTSKDITIKINSNNNRDCSYYGTCKNKKNTKDCSYYGTCNNKKSNTYLSAVTTFISQASPTSATFNGNVYTNGTTSFASFEYGTTARLGKITSKLTSNGGYTTNFAYTVYGLRPNTTYYFRIVGESNGDITVGDILYFKTPSAGIITNVVTNTTNTDKTNTNTTTKTIDKNNSSNNNDANSSNNNFLEKNSDGSFLAAGAGFSGSFFPGTILGWLLIVLFILILILVIKKVFPEYSKKNLQSKSH